MAFERRAGTIESNRYVRPPASMLMSWPAGNHCVGRSNSWSRMSVSPSSRNLRSTYSRAISSPRVPAMRPQYFVRSSRLASEMSATSRTMSFMRAPSMVA